MKIDARKLLNEINDSIGSRPIFKNNTEDLVSYLIDTGININILSFSIGMDTLLIDDFIRQFRTILKFIFLYSSFNNKTSMSQKEIIDEFHNMTFDFKMNYAPIRNYLEQCSLGKRMIEYDEKTDTYIEKEIDGYSNYSRIHDQLKVFPSDVYKDEARKTIRCFDMKKSKPKYFFKGNPAKQAMADLIKATWIDSEIKEDYDFKDFTYEEMIRFCAGLKFIGMMYYGFTVFSPKNYIEKEEMISYLKDLTNLEEKKILFFLELNTYNIEYQKDKLTLIQPLILIGNKYYFFPITIDLSILPIKMYRVLNDLYKDKYEKDLSKIARIKEQQMLSDIQKLLDKFELKIIPNYQLYDKNHHLIGEYDLLIYDKNESTLYICECKWFFVKDDERDNVRLDKRLLDSIEKRKEQDKLLIDNIDIFVKEHLSDCEKPKKHISFIISQNNLGSVKFDVPVVNYETMEEEINKYDSFNKFMDSIFDEDYKNKYELSNFQTDLKIDKYKFKIFLIAHKE